MRRLVLSSGLAAVALLSLSSLHDLPPLLVYNGSESAPIGFYWVDGGPVAKGIFVLVRVPGNVRTLVERRGYLPPDVPLIKRVVGVEGDEICRFGQWVLVNGRRVAEAQWADGAGRPMPVWNGCETLNQSRIFLLQQHPQSFDGRYLGPLDSSLVIGRVTALWTRKLN